MYHCKLTPYEGNAEYIFVSYAHKDSDEVLPILDALSDRGYRIWYDEGITPGSEWPEYIAERLNSSSLVLAFVSPASQDSDNCRREITFALSKKIDLLAVMLEPTELTLGMEMQLASHQCVLRFKYPSFDQFIEKICSMPELEGCSHTVRGKHVRPSAVPISRSAEAVADPPAPRKLTAAATAEKKRSSDSAVFLILGIIIALALVSAVAILFSVEKQEEAELPTFVTAATPSQQIFPSASPVSATAAPIPSVVPTQAPAQTVQPDLPVETAAPEETPYVYVPAPETTPSITYDPQPVPTAELTEPEAEIEIPSIVFTPEPIPTTEASAEAGEVLPAEGVVIQ